MTNQAEIALYASDGKLLIATSIDAGYSEIDGTRELQQAVYIVVVETPEKTWRLKWSD